MRVLKGILFCLLPFLMAGCAFFSGSIDEGMPKLHDKLPETTKVFIACPLKPTGAPLYSRNGKLVADEFKAAFKARGISAVMDDRRSGATGDVLVSAKTNGCDVVLFTQVLSWNYGDNGFLPFGGNREEAYIAVMLMKPEPPRVITRANLNITAGLGKWPFADSDNPGECVAPIILKYVESLFKKKD